MKTLSKILDLAWGVTKFHFTRKFLMMAFVPFMAKAVGYNWEITPLSIVYLIAFFAAYSSIYFVNDIIDLENDKNKTFYYSSKKLVNGNASMIDYLDFGYMAAIVGLTASFLLNRDFGFFVFLNLLLAHLRHHINFLMVRTLVLGLLEFLNLAAMTLVFAPLSALFNPALLMLYLALCALYMFLYYGYRYRNGEDVVKYAKIGVILILAVLGFHVFRFKPNILPILVIVPLAITYAAAWVITLRLKNDTLMSAVQLAGGLLLAFLTNYWLV